LIHLGITNKLKLGITNKLRKVCNMIMKILKYSLIYLAVSVSLSASIVHAISPEQDDGNEDFGQDDTDFGRSEFSDRAEGRIEREAKRRKTYIVDHSFEEGKSIYYGQKDGVPKLPYCITFGEDKKRLKTKTLKPYKNTSFSKLASSLYNCDTPEKHIKADLQRDDFLYVLYYLDTRYKLNLKRE